MLVVSEKGLEFIKAFEGSRQDKGGHFMYNDPAGYATIGYGHLVAKRPVLPSEKEIRISEQQALVLLREDLEEAIQGVNMAFTGGFLPDLEQHQIDALASWFFNLGVSAKTLGSGLVQLLTSRVFWGAWEKNRMWPVAAVREEFGMWVRAGGKVLPGLIARRQAEARLFVEGRYLDGK